MLLSCKKNGRCLKMRVSSLKTYWFPTWKFPTFISWVFLFGGPFRILYQNTTVKWIIQNGTKWHVVAWNLDVWNVWSPKRKIRCIRNRHFLQIPKSLTWSSWDMQKETKGSRLQKPCCIPMIRVVLWGFVKAFIIKHHHHHHNWWCSTTGQLPK